MLLSLLTRAGERRVGHTCEKPWSFAKEGTLGRCACLGSIRPVSFIWAMKPNHIMGFIIHCPNHSRQDTATAVVTAAAVGTTAAAVAAAQQQPLLLVVRSALVNCMHRHHSLHHESLSPGVNVIAREHCACKARATEIWRFSSFLLGKTTKRDQT